MAIVPVNSSTSTGASTSVQSLPYQYRKIPPAADPGGRPRVRQPGRRSAGGAGGWEAVGAPGDPRSDVVAECPLASLPRVSDAVGATREPWGTACLPDGRDGCASWHAGCGAGVRLETWPIRTALSTLPVDTRDRRWPTSGNHRGLRRPGLPPISPHSAPCDGVCGARVGAGHGESIAAGTDSGAGVHGDGIDVGGEDRRPHRWGERWSCVKRWRTAVAVDRASPGGRPMARADARLAAMLHVPAVLRACTGLQPVVYGDEVRRQWLDARLTRWRKRPDRCGRNP